MKKIKCAKFLINKDLKNCFPRRYVLNILRLENSEKIIFALKIERVNPFKVSLL